MSVTKKPIFLHDPAGPTPWSAPGLGLLCCFRPRFPRNPIFPRPPVWPPALSTASTLKSNSLAIMKNAQKLFAALMFAGAGAYADVPLSNTWGFFNPEGTSQLDNQSATGFDLICNPTSGGIVQANATYVTTIALDRATPSTGVLVTAPGHGIAVGNTAAVYLNQTSVEAYNTLQSATAHTATAVTVDTLAIPTLNYAGDATGGTVGTDGTTIAASLGSLRPRVYQVFTPVNMSAIGAAFSVQFDFSLISPSQAANNDVFRVFIGDTVKNAEIIGMFDLGVNSRDDGIKILEDNRAFNSPPYTTSNPYEGAMGTGGQSWNVEGHFPQPGGEAANRLAVTGTMYRMYINLVRNYSGPNGPKIKFS